MPLEDYIKFVNKNNEDILHYYNSNKHETIKRICLADTRKIALSKKEKKISVQKGQVCQFEFGNNIFPEMSFEHRGLIMGQSKNLLYVLPICTYNRKYKEHKEAFHLVDNNTKESKKSICYLIKKNEFSFISRDSVIKLDDLKSISKNRLIYNQGKMDINSDIFKSIEAKVIQRFFQDFYFNFVRMQSEIESKDNELNELKEIKEQMLKELELKDNLIKELKEEKFLQKDLV